MESDRNFFQGGIFGPIDGGTLSGLAARDCKRE